MAGKKQPKKYLTREEREALHKKRIRNQKLQATCIIGGFLFVLVLGIVSVIRHNTRTGMSDNVLRAEEPTTEEVIMPLTSGATAFPDLHIDEQYLTVNEYSRPGTALTKVKHIVIHYTANPGTSAQNNRNYFEGLKDSGLTSASSHFVIGLEGEIIQCIPMNEWCYASNELNSESISIEMCHPDETGAFNDATYNSCVFLVAQLCNYYHLTAKDVIRHYDITGKECPKYFVDHPDRWEKFQGFITKWQKEYKDTPAVTEAATIEDTSTEDASQTAASR